MEDLYSLKDLMHDSIKDLNRKISEKKYALILERVHAFTKVEKDFDIVKECQKVFPRIKAVQYGDEERYYWDDWSENGHLLITFYSVFNLDDNGNKVVMTCAIKYR